MFLVLKKVIFLWIVSLMNYIFFYIYITMYFRNSALLCFRKSAEVLRFQAVEKGSCKLQQLGLPYTMMKVVIMTVVQVQVQGH